MQTAGSEVYRAITAITAALSKTGISKNRTNQKQGYAFRGIDDVYSALSGLLGEHGLCVIPRVVKRDVTERVSSSGNALFYVVVDVEFDLVSDKDASTHTCRVCGEAMDTGDKATNKAMSAAYKYFALMTFCIPTEGDNDADASTHDVVATEREAVDRKAAMLANKLLSALDAEEAGATEEEVHAAKSARLRAIHEEANKDSDLYREAWKLLDSKQRSAIKVFLGQTR